MKKENSTRRMRDFMGKSRLDALKKIAKHFKKNKPAKPYKLSDEFDLLCIVNGKKQRLPFSSGQHLSPIAIFPFAKDNRYIELDEQEGKKHTDEDVDESRLLDRGFCDHVFRIKDRLNLFLKALNKPLLEGAYLADSNYMQGCGWIIGFDDNDFHTLSSDYYGGNLEAKLRYSGTFNEK